MAAGTTTVSASVGNVSDSTGLTVTAAPPHLQSISLTPTVTTLTIGATQQYRATGTYSDGAIKDITGAAQWASSVPSVGAVTTTGRFSALRAGTATISATLDGIQATASVTVNTALQYLSITPGATTLAVGNNRQFTATATYGDGSTVDVSQIVTWQSDPSVATVNNTGLVTAVGSGIINLYASIGSTNATANITVPGNARLRTIAVSPAYISMVAGTTQQLTATAIYFDGSSQDVTAGATWTSAAAQTATVSSSGLVTAVGDGTVNIMAAFTGFSGIGNITVVAAPANRHQYDRMDRPTKRSVEQPRKLESGSCPQRE